MSDFFKNFTPLLLVILKFCFSVSGNFTIKDLGLVCAIRKNDKLTAIPKECTAVAVYSLDIDILVGINQIRRGLPLLIISGNTEWKNTGDIIKLDFSKVMDPFENIEYDFMVFDDMYKVFQLFGGSTAVTKYSENIGSLLNQLRAKFPGRQFGLVLGHDVSAMKEKVDLSILTNHSDLFLLESTGYRDCGMHTHQSEMEVLATKDDVFSSLTDLKNLNIPMDKVIYTIELKIESRKQVFSEDMDYTYLCSNELSDDRKYCFNTIQNLFEKARLRISEGTAGIFINGVDFDDYNGTCGCKTPTDPEACFRGLKTIAGASLENTNEVSFYECSEGSYPVIKN